MVEATLYFDFEALGCKPEVNQLGTNVEVLTNHQPIMYAFIILDKDNKLLVEEVKYYRKNAHVEFIKRLLELEEKMRKQVYRNLPMRKLAKEEKDKIYKSKNCSHCHQSLADDSLGWPCLDHCHYR